MLLHLGHSLPDPNPIPMAQSNQLSDGGPTDWDHVKHIKIAASKANHKANTKPLEISYSDLSGENVLEVARMIPY